MAECRKITVKPSDEYVRPLGRTDYNGEYRLLALSGTGIEFTYFGSTCTITMLGDSTTDAEVETLQDLARIGIIVDGRMQLKTEIKRSRETFHVIRNASPMEMEPAQHVIRIVKLSEAAMSSVAVESITVVATEEPVPTPAPEKRVEIIGDSITCGYGVEAPDELHNFSTTSENVTMSYSYLTAQELGVDYSMVSYSGHGIVSGYVQELWGMTINEKELVPPYYEYLGYSYNNFRGRQLNKEPWDFAWQPDVIVINLGTNDNSYTKDIPERVAEYERLYVEFLKMVRSHNGAAHIVCALGIMGDELYPAVERVVQTYQQTTGDENISAFHFTPQNPELNGYGADFHPSPVSQQIAAKELVQELRRWL